MPWSGIILKISGFRAKRAKATYSKTFRLRHHAAAVQAPLLECADSSALRCDPTCRAGNPFGIGIDRKGFSSSPLPPSMGNSDLLANSQLQLIEHKKSPFVGFPTNGRNLWRRPTLAWPIAILPSGLKCFNSVFEMGTGGATTL